MAKNMTVWGKAWKVPKGQKATVISPTILPTFKGYTVDERLREFRKVDMKKPSIEFVEFDSPKGRKLLKELAMKGYDKKLKVVV
jgi:hypothetical protein